MSSVKIATDVGLMLDSSGGCELVAMTKKEFGLGNVGGILDSFLMA